MALKVNSETGNITINNQVCLSKLPRVREHFLGEGISYFPDFLNGGIGILGLVLGSGVVNGLQLIKGSPGETQVEVRHRFLSRAGIQSVTHVAGDLISFELLDVLF